jgi:hypothetical protein
MYRIIILAAPAVLLLVSGAALAQNCCSPAVSQQGVLGETTALPQTLEAALHYEHLRSRDKYEGSTKVDDPEKTEAGWDRVLLTLAYGVVPRVSVAAVVPYVRKEKSWYLYQHDLWKVNQTEGFGDCIVLARFSVVERTFVNFREVAVGLGFKAPTGSTDKRDAGLSIPLELQPGTGSWDYLGSLSFYQGFKKVDLIAGATYVLTTEYEGYEFGDQLSYQVTANLHATGRLDLSAGLSGIVRGRDIGLSGEVYSTGQHQLFAVPGVHYQIIPKFLRLQAFFEYPVYQHFNGRQLAGDFNLRFSASFSIPFSHEEVIDDE